MSLKRARAVVEAGPVILSVRVQPKASENRVVGFDEAERLKVRVTAAPTDGKANAAVIGVIAEALDIPRRRVSIERGHSSRSKTVRVEGIGGEAVRTRLAQSGRR